MMTKRLLSLLLAVTCILWWAHPVMAERPAHVEIVTRDAAGAPIGGALAVAVPIGDRAALDPSSLVIATSSREGASTLVLAEGKTYSLSVLAPGFRGEYRSNVPDIGRIVVVLQRGGGAKVRARFSDGNGPPIEKLRVLLGSVSDPSGPMFAADLDNQGRVELEVPRRDDYVLAWLSSSYRPGVLKPTDNELQVRLERRYPTLIPASTLVTTCLAKASVSLSDSAISTQLRSSFRGAKVVAIGENTHGAREFNEFRLAIVRHLVEREGFRAIALEASVPDVATLDEYLRTGRGNPTDAVKGLHFWTLANEGMLAIVTWVRGFNATHTRDTVHMFGLDVQYPTAAVQHVTQYLEKCGLDSAAILEEARRLGDLQPGVNVRAMSKERRHALARWAELAGAAMAKDKATCIAKTSDAEWVLREAERRSIAQGTQMLGGAAGGASRDAIMGENLEFIMRSIASGSKIVLLAHNEHVARRKPSKQVVTLMEEAEELAKGQVRSIGCVFDRGAFWAIGVTGDPEHRKRVFSIGTGIPGSVENALRGVGKRSFLIDLRGLAEPCSAWMSDAHPMRSIGAVYNDGTPEEYLRSERASELYDMLFFSEEIRPAEPLSGAVPGS